jgi:ferredoxin-type protein NapG
MKKQLTRRDFVARIGGAAALFGAGAYIAPKLYAKSINPLRPPGALEERAFLATCIKCGQCVQVCPYHSLHIYDITALNSIGTPHIEAGERGCYLCDLFPCVLACPTGSLSHDVSEAKDVHMGVAIINDIESCLAYKGEVVSDELIAPLLAHSNRNEREAKVLDDVRSYVGKSCTICASLCPYPEQERAIVMSEVDGVPKVRESCVGCGVCAELCPVQVIKILPRKSYSEVYG